MSRVDTAWLSMERPTNPMMITGVLMFAEPMSLDGLKRVIKQRFLAYTRFSQRAVETATGASWQTDEDFDLDWVTDRLRAKFDQLLYLALMADWTVALDPARAESLLPAET